MYRAIRCSCRHKSCPDWHVSDVADVQGVHFTKEQAEAVAALLNGATASDPEDDYAARRAADRIDGYDRDDLGESPDY
jgi:hypothetical protein